MKRYIFVILFFVVLTTPFALRWVMGVAQAPRERDAERLIILTPHNEAIRNEFAFAFSNWHQEHFGTPVVIDYRTMGGNEVIRYFRAARETVYDRLGTFKVDIVWGGGDYLFDHDLRRIDVLEPVELDPKIMERAFPESEIAGLALYAQDHPPRWFGTALSSFGIVYNKDVLRHLEVEEPRTWSDLRNPRLRGWIVLADPTRSSTARSTFMIIVERAMADAEARGESPDIGWAHGMGIIRQISANARLFNDAGSALPGMVSSGEVAAGMVIDFFARSQLDVVGEGRLGYIEPAGATAINPDPIALVRGSENRDVAVRFIEFCLSEPGQRLWNTRPGAPSGPQRHALRRLPVMLSLYDDMSDFTDQVNPYTAAEGFNTSHERRGTFRILGEIIEVSCMHLLEELRSTRQVILDSPLAQELDAQLGIFPFDQSEALRLNEQWWTISPLQQLQMQRRMTIQFRQEYRALREQAQRAAQIATGPSRSD